jgi:hypothetical protein
MTWCCLCPFVNQLGFILARTLPGLLKCCITVSQAYVTDVSPPADRAKNFGTLFICFKRPPYIYDRITSSLSRAP